MKLAILRKPQESAITYYRLTPWLELARQNNWQAHEFAPKQFNADSAHLFDALIVSRPGSADELMPIVIAKNVGVKVIVDIDDLMWAIPVGNDAFRHYSPDVHDVLSRGLLWADAVTCSTDALRMELKAEFDIDAEVLYNRYNDRSIVMQKPSDWKGKIRVLWRGSNTHHTDLFKYRDAFQEFENVQFEFFGPVPWYFLEQYGGKLKNLICHSFKYDVLSYFQKLKELKPDFMAFPLEDNKFNRAKSNISWIEATQSGAAFIGPALPEFDGLKISSFEKPDELLEYFKYLDEFPRTAKAESIKFVNTMQEHLKYNFKLSDENQKRAQILVQ